MILFPKSAAVGATAVKVTAVGVPAARNDLEFLTIINIGFTTIL